MAKPSGHTAWWWIRLAAGFSVLAVLGWIIDPKQILSAFTSARVFPLALAFFLLLPNLWFQYAKWKAALCTRYPDTTGTEALHSLLYGFAFGIVTPARLGEFGGRLAVDKRFQNAATVGLVAVDKFSAMVVTVACGVWGLAFWGWHFQWYSAGIALLFVLVGCAIPVIAWKVLRWFYAWLQQRHAERSWLYRQIAVIAEGAGALTSSQFRTLLGYSTGFYATFTVQFVLLLLAFTDAPVFYALAGIACVMIAKTVVPPVTVGELGIREGFAVFFLSMIGVPAEAAFSASILLFFINVFLPSIAGGVLLLRSTFQPRFQE